MGAGSVYGCLPVADADDHVTIDMNRVNEMGEVLLSSTTISGRSYMRACSLSLRSGRPTGLPQSVREFQQTISAPQPLGPPSVHSGRTVFAGKLTEFPRA